MIQRDNWALRDLPYQGKDVSPATHARHQKVVALSSLVALSAAAIAPALAQQSLNGAGATFPAPLYQKWFQELARAGGPRVITKLLDLALACAR